MKGKNLAKPFRIARGADFHLRDCDPADTLGFSSKAHAADRLADGVSRLADLQEKLHAQDRWAQRSWRL